MIELLQATGAAGAAAGQQPGMGGFWIMIVLMIVVLYFFMWRPESKRRKEMAKFREGLKKGDKIITAGGIYGTVKEVKDTTLLIEVDSNVTLRIDKNMVVADNSQLQTTDTEMKRGHIGKCDLFFVFTVLPRCQYRFCKGYSLLGYSSSSTPQSQKWNSSCAFSFGKRK